MKCGIIKFGTSKTYFFPSGTSLFHFSSKTGNGVFMRKHKSEVRVYSFD
jgi:hypothetical protein